MDCFPKPIVRRIACACSPPLPRPGGDRSLSPCPDPGQETGMFSLRFVVHSAKRLSKGAEREESQSEHLQSVRATFYGVF